MKNFIQHSIKRFFILACFGISGFMLLSADEPTRIELVESDSMMFDRRIGEDVRRLIGNVHFRHEETNMFCDSAYLFSATNSIRAYGNIFIEVSDTVSIFGDELYYNGNTRKAELTGNVEMIDNQMTLTTGHLLYDMNSNTAKYVNGGRIVDAENDLTSIWGFYYADDKHFFFKDSVKLVNPEYVMRSDTLKYNTLNEVAYFFGPTTIISDENSIYCENGWYDTRNDISRFSKNAFLTNNEQSLTGDSLFYDRNKGFGRAERNIQVRDSVQNTLITGHLAEHFEKEGLSVVTKEAMLIIIEETDSLFMHADTLKSTYDEDKDERIVFAYHRGRFFRDDLQGQSDSIVYNFADSTIYLFHNPVVWSDEHQLTARRMEIKTSDNRVESARLFDAAFIISQEDTLGFNQVKGRKLVGHFRENELRQIDVFGNGETLYYVREEDGSMVGINKALASDIIIFVEDRQVTGIRFLQNPDANLFPPEEISREERLLRDFHWLEDIRPRSKADIFIWP